ncbi:MAG: S-layer homology domain-containing protein [Candidatus Margulisbacteria bacterium]|nr:S-layer homology domain-containing protein [Candidatus Margulisiibacteriota bacterium]
MKFKDVPESHWAASAVYDLVKLGVTNGYPDGTFRGTKQITRYETAVFLSKLAKAVGAATNVSSDIDALKKDVAALKSRRSPSGAGLPLMGSYKASWMFGNLLAEKGGIRGAVASYRLQLTTVQDMGGGAEVAINLDTMDYGFMDDGSNSTGGALATDLIDIVSSVPVNLSAMGLADPVKLELAVGPGSKQHSADPAGTIPSEIGVTYVRPGTYIAASTNMGGADVYGRYKAKQHPASGRVQSNQITGKIGYAFSGVPMVNTMKLDVTGDYFSAGQFSTETRDLRGIVGVSAPLTDKIEASAKLGVGGTDGSSNMMIAGALALDDILDTGTVATIQVSKVGSKFISTEYAAEEFDYAGYDNFMRPLINNTVNIGGTVVQTVSDDIKLVGKGDIRLNGLYDFESTLSRLTAEGGISYAIAPNTSLDATYRVYKDQENKDTSDIAALGLMYNF